MVENACLIYPVFEHGMLAEPEETLFELFQGPVTPLSPDVVLSYIRDYCPTIAPPHDPILHKRVVKCAEELVSSSKLPIVRSNSPKHHPIIEKYSPWSGLGDPRYFYNFLGAKTQRSFFDFTFKPNTTQQTEINTRYPTFDEEYFEYIDILEAIENSQESFTMVELGAGFGRWLVNAAVALRKESQKPIKLVGIEAEPTHWQMMLMHFMNNEINPQEHELIEAACATSDEPVFFICGHSDQWYGQAIVSSPDARQAEFPKAHTKQVAAVSLPQILNHLKKVDIIDLDVQGSEFEILCSAAGELDQKVKRVHIGTHSREIEDQLRTLFTELGWINVHDYQCQTQNSTPYGEIFFQDGVQGWINPKL